MIAEKPGTAMMTAARVCACIAGFAAILLPAGTANAVTPPGAGAQMALATGRVVGISSDLCGNDATMSAFSDDRGVTWRAGRCVPSGYALQPNADGRSVSYIAGNGNELVQLDADGAVSAEWPTRGGVMLASTGVEGSQAYAWSHDRGLVSVSAAGEAACGTTPGISGDSERFVAAIGPLVVLMGDGGVNSWQFAISNDSCVSFMTVTADKTECDFLSLQPDGGIVCFGTRRTRLDAHNPVAGWSPSDLPEMSVPYGLARAGLELHPLDPPARSWAPWTWPESVRTLGKISGGSPSPGGEFGAGLAYLNNRFRRPLGLADAVWQPQFAVAAERHAAYWRRNGAGAGLQAHDETPGKPGFRGATPTARCKAAGARDGCSGEVAIVGIPSPVDAMASWLGTPFHGVPLLRALRIGIGAGPAGAAAELDIAGGSVNTAAGITVYDYDAPANTPSATEHVWPANGMHDVPSAWAEGEYPDPLAAYTGDRGDVGPILFYSTLNPVRVTLENAIGGGVPLIEPGTRRGAVRSVMSRGGFDTEAVFAGHVLSAGGRYTLVLSPEMPGLPERRFTFTVSRPKSTALPASATTRLSVRTTVASCREIIVRKRLKGRRAAVRFAPSGCRPQTVQIYRRGAWRALRKKATVLAHGKKARWRVIYRRRVIASGVITG